MPSHKYCCVPFCHSSKRREKELSFHEFPANVELCHQWLKVISRKDFTPNDKSNSSVVCGKHFKGVDFVQYRTRRCLKKDAVPSIFPGYPSYKVPCSKKSTKKPTKAALSKTDHMHATERKKMKLDSSKSGAVKRKAIETQIEEPDDIQVKIEPIESLDRNVIVSEVEVFDDDAEEFTADTDITWTQPEPRESEPKILRVTTLEHFKPASSDLGPIRDIHRPSRERSPECRSSDVPQKQPGNSVDVHFQNSIETFEDPIEIFGKSVVAQLKMLPKRQAISTQLKIQAILTEQLLNYEDSRI